MAWNAHNFSCILFCIRDYSKYEKNFYSHEYVQNFVWDYFSVFFTVHIFSELSTLYNVLGILFYSIFQLIFLIFTCMIVIWCELPPASSTIVTVEMVRFIKSFIIMKMYLNTHFIVSDKIYDEVPCLCKNNFAPNFKWKQKISTIFQLLLFSFCSSISFQRVLSQVKYTHILNIHWNNDINYEWKLSSNYLNRANRTNWNNVLKNFTEVLACILCFNFIYDICISRQWKYFGKNPEVFDFLLMPYFINTTISY